MGYGDDPAGVLFELGIAAAETSGFYTTTHITAAIAQADIIVDTVNSSASAARKTQASNYIAAQVLRDKRANGEILEGITDSGDSGRPSKIRDINDLIAKITPFVVLMLGSSLPLPSITEQVPADGEFV